MALFRKFAKRVLIGTCTATGNFIGYVISTIKMYALLTKHEVKKQDILRFMVRKFPIVFTLIRGGVLRDETKSDGRQSEYGFRGPNGTFPGDTPRASLPRRITRSRLDCVTNQKTSAKEAIPAVVAPCERNCSSAQLS